MDLKAISWVGNIYQKFETMCLEVEEAMYQDTVKYVENQVNTVGSSVKRFYSEVMQDVHPQYNIDPVKVAAADLSLNPYAHYEIDKKLKANLRESTKGFSNKLNDDTQVIKGKIRSGGLYKRQNVGIKEIARQSHQAEMAVAICHQSADVIKSSSTAAEVRGGFGKASDHVTLASDLSLVKGSDSGDKASKFRHNTRESVGSSSNSAASSTPIESVKGSDSGDKASDFHHNTKESVGASINSVASLTTMSVESVGQKKQELSGNSIPVVGFSPDSCAAYTKELACNLRSEVSSDAQNREFDNKEINESCEDRTSDLSCAMPKKDVTTESEVEIIEKLDESQLGEACVLVEGDTIHVPYSPVKQKSYKKKLREAFSTKKTLTRKEYKRLGALYEDQQFSLEAKDKVMPVLSMSSNTQSSSVKDQLESEWEIL